MTITKQDLNFNSMLYFREWFYGHLYGNGDKVALRRSIVYARRWRPSKLENLASLLNSYQFQTGVPYNKFNCVPNEM